MFDRATILRSDYVGVLFRDPSGIVTPKLFSGIGTTLSFEEDELIRAQRSLVIRHTQQVFPLQARTINLDVSDAPSLLR
jgi:hypothetical protein